MAQLRFLVRPIYQEHGLNPDVVVPVSSTFNSRAAMRNASFLLQGQEKLEQMRGKAKLEQRKCWLGKGFAAIYWE
jgi:hypothetical protein